MQLAVTGEKLTDRVYLCFGGGASPVQGCLTCTPRMVTMGFQKKIAQAVPFYGG